VPFHGNVFPHFLHFNPASRGITALHVLQYTNPYPLFKSIFFRFTMTAGGSHAL
jgi:hypothetical protein